MYQRQPYEQPAVTLLLVAAIAKTWSAVTNAWRALLAERARTYRPEAHYMRGPGPKWRAKHVQIRNIGDR
jgi:hypothetical protein